MSRRRIQNNASKRSVQIIKLFLFFFVDGIQKIFLEFHGAALHTHSIHSLGMAESK
jgi:hypothetical protein